MGVANFDYSFYMMIHGKKVPNSDDHGLILTVFSPSPELRGWVNMGTP